MKITIVANYKMNPQKLAEAKKLFSAVLKVAPGAPDLDIVICPPFIYLADLTSAFAKATADNHFNNLHLGGQNCFYESTGAFTGEISGTMLKSLGCKYVILGHSERRQYQNETSEIINKKIKAALEASLKPILCVGEKEGEEMHLIVEEQLRAGLNGIPAEQIEKVIIAYEPVWAIDTGNSCSPEKAMEANLFIRRILSQLYERKIADKLPVLYGGSVNDKNASDYIKISRMNGLLVGGASLNIKIFSKIIKEI